jgi:hypothetical protein
VLWKRGRGDLYGGFDPAGRSVVLVRDEEPECNWGEGGVEFRLTYDGELRATRVRVEGTQTDKRAEHKYMLRREFHAQLRRLWEITPSLRTGARSGPSLLLSAAGGPAVEYDVPSLSARHSHYGFEFAPLVTRELDLLCSLEFLILRPKPVTEAAWTGDIDNRLKTLIDALSVPVANEHWHKREPAEDEKPFFCLLEDDKLLTKVSLETDHLLKPADVNDVSVVITVRIRPADVRVDNFHFA